MPFGNAYPESQRDSVSQPRVASLRATLGKVPNDDQPQRGCVFPLIFGQFELPKGIRIRAYLQNDVSKSRCLSMTLVPPCYQSFPTGNPRA